MGSCASVLTRFGPRTRNWSSNGPSGQVDLRPSRTHSGDSRISRSRSELRRLAATAPSSAGRPSSAISCADRLLSRALAPQVAWSSHQQANVSAIVGLDIRREINCPDEPPAPALAPGDFPRAEAGTNRVGADPEVSASLLRRKQLRERQGGPRGASPWHPEMGSAREDVAGVPSVTRVGAGSTSLGCATLESGDRKRRMRPTRDL